MTALHVRGGQQLMGRIEPSANKNAVLPVLCATLLSDAPIMLRNVPEITDVTRIHAFFSDLGSTVHWDKAAQTLAIDHSTIRRGREGQAAAGNARQHHDDPRPARAAGRSAAGARSEGLHAWARARSIRMWRCSRPSARKSATKEGHRVPSQRQGRRHPDVAGICQRHHHREFHHHRADRERHQPDRQRRLRTARAGNVRLPRSDGRDDPGQGHLHGVGGRVGGASARSITPLSRISTKSPPSWRWRR